MNTEKKEKVCIISFSNIAWDGRVLRQIFTLKNLYKLSVIGHGEWNPPSGVEYFQITNTGLGEGRFNRIFCIIWGKINPSFFDRFYWSINKHNEAFSLLRGKKFKLIHANDIDALPLAIRLNEENGGKIIFDAHEYSPGQLSNTNLVFRYLKRDYFSYLIKKYTKKSDKVITVSEGLVDLYRENFNLQSSIIYNAPYYKKCNFNSVDEKQIRIVHHGVASKNRCIEDIIYLAELLKSNFSIYLHLVSNNAKYFQYIKKLSRRISGQRIKVLPPIKSIDIPNFINSYDIGIHLLKGTNLNHINALPNKLFDFIMAGLSIAIYPLPNMKKIVLDNKIGIVSKRQNIESMANALNNLTIEEIEEHKQNSLLLAKKINAENEGNKLIKIYQELFI